MGVIYSLQCWFHQLIRDEFVQQAMRAYVVALQAP